MSSAIPPGGAETPRPVPPTDAGTARPAPPSGGPAPSSTPATGATAPAVGAAHDPRELLRRQREQFGGMKFGACFFGWLTATGTAVLLTALASAVAFGVGTPGGVSVDPTAANQQTAGIVGAVVGALIILVAYFCGGYVAGRMARFDGVKQGLGVWLWAVIAAVVVAVLALVAGDQFNVLARLSGVQLPVDAGSLTAAGLLTALIVAAVALVGAILGGLAGMRFHRRVDRRTDLSPEA